MDLASDSSAALASGMPRSAHNPAHNQSLSDLSAPSRAVSPHDLSTLRPPTSEAGAAPNMAATTQPTAAAATMPPSFTSATPSTTSLNTVTPNSPSTSSSNRFGLALGFIGRRPRGFTNPSAMTSAGTRSPGVVTGKTPNANSPSSELPPSPGTAERNGYGFPSLRRTLSKRTPLASPSAQLPSSSSNPNFVSDGSRTRSRRSLSQPPPPMIVDPAGSSVDESGATGSNSRLRPRTATDSGQARASQTASSQAPLSSLAATASLSTSNSASQTPFNEKSSVSHRFRLVPHLESSRSLHFEPIDRDLAPSTILRVGRFTDRSNQLPSFDPQRIAFKSKVVSRGHAEIWTDESGKFFVKDTKSSSGTFLNHIRLSGPNAESRAFPLKDGDILQLGVDYQGGTEEIYRCVKMRIELNRGWQRGVNSFNTAALAQLRALGGGSAVDVDNPARAAPITATASSNTAQLPQSASVTDCCICLYPVTVCQALFIAPCSHVTHFKCIRPLILQNYPGFSCPLCRTYADLEADVEVDLPELESTHSVPAVTDAPSIVNEEPESELDACLAQTSAAPASLRLAHGAPGTVEEAVSLMAVHSTMHDPNTEEVDESAAVPIPRTATSMVVSDAVLASLANAATPPNSTFLSTLADRGDTFVPRFRTPVAGLEMALLASPEAGPSSLGGHRSSFGSETDASKDEATGGDVLDEHPDKSADAVNRRKGKGRQIDESIGKSGIPVE